MAPILKLEGVHVSYGPVHVLRGISLEVQTAELVAIIGSNGAGKTTLFRAIAGLAPVTPPKSIMFDGRFLDHMRPEQIVRLGLVTVPQGRRIFPGLTVRENLIIATSAWRKRGMSYEEDLERVYNLFPRLKEREKQLGWSLSGGEQQMLAVGRGLMSHPKLLLLDEPSVGLAPRIMEQMFEAIKKINENGTTIMVVEQNAAMALAIAHRGYVLEMGQVVLTDTAPNLMKNDMVKRAYVGALAG